MHVAAVTQTSLQAKLKLDENGHALRVASDMISYFVDVFTFFQKRKLLSVSLTFCFILKIDYKNENWYHCRFHLPGFYYQKQPSMHVLRNVVNKIQEKQLWWISFFKKIKTEINLI